MWRKIEDNEQPRFIAPNRGDAMVTTLWFIIGQKEDDEDFFVWCDRDNQAIQAFYSRAEADEQAAELADRFEMIVQPCFSENFSEMQQDEVTTVASFLLH